MQQIHDKVDFKLSYIGKYVNPPHPDVASKRPSVYTYPC